MNKENKWLPTDIPLFDGAKIRKERIDWVWYFSVIDIIEQLTWSNRPSKYWTDLKNELIAQWFTEVSDKIGKLKMKGKDGKSYPTDSTDTQTILRIIQAVPSPNAEPFKQRLAQLGNERMEEYNDPELWIQRARERAITVYKKRWMTDSEIKTRLDMIETRHTITDIRKAARIVGREYGMLTNLWYNRTGLDAERLKKLKWLAKSDNLRDHFSRPEMLLSQLAEETAIRLTEKRWSKWFMEVQKDVIEGADVAKKAKQHMEDAIWESIITRTNRLSDRQKKLRKEKSLTKRNKQKKL